MSEERIISSTTRRVYTTNSDGTTVQEGNLASGGFQAGLSDKGGAGYSYSYSSSSGGGGRSAGAESILASTYRPTLSQRSIVINRSVGASLPVSASKVKKSYQYSTGMSAGMIMPSFAPQIGTEVSSMKVNREKEKKDMQDLNERFASYIEKVRFLEAQNKRLIDELEKLKIKWGKETTQIKVMFEAELEQARKLLDDAEKEKARLEIRVATLEEVNEEYANKINDLNLVNDDLRNKLDRQNQQMVEHESEVSLYRKRIETFENDRERDKKTIANLNLTIKNLRINLDDETLKHIDAENRRQTLEEEIEFLKQIHNEEMKELAALAYRDTTAENRDFWKNEMGTALREIQEMYDEKFEFMRTEIESSYETKFQEYARGASKKEMETSHTKEETKRLKAQISDYRNKISDLEGRVSQLERDLKNALAINDELRKEHEIEKYELEQELIRVKSELKAFVDEIQILLQNKTSLEIEIAAYRKLLEGEESRSGLKQIIDRFIEGGSSSSVSITSGGGGSSFVSGGGGGSGSGSTSYVSGGGGGGGSGSAVFVSGGGSGSGGGSFSKGEMSARTTYQKSAKGPTSIAETSADGKFIVIENTGRKVESLGGWRLTRMVDDQETFNFVFPVDLKLSANEKFKIWAKGQKPFGAPATDIEANVENFGIGTNITTKLFNINGEDRATHLQKTVYG